MRIKKLSIKNYKSLVDFTLENPKQFCAFVGPNASGKSNIFEALEFSNFAFKYASEAAFIFGGKRDIFSYNPIEHWQFGKNTQSFFYQFSDDIIIDFHFRFPEVQRNNSQDVLRGYTMHHLQNIEFPDPFYLRDLNIREAFLQKLADANINYDFDYEQFVDRFSRIFIKNSNIVRFLGSPRVSGNNLMPDASNLAQILGNIFSNDTKKDEFIEWLSILIPEFKNIEVTHSNIDGLYDFKIYEKGSSKSFPKHLLSDGTNNILALLAAVYQDDQPQFLCIEEPENGLHPQAIERLIDFFREKSENDGHYIWLNTHSQSLVRCLEIDEIILINKVNGKTIPRQLTEKDKINIKTDEAWLTNALGGGTLWST